MKELTVKGYLGYVQNRSKHLIQVVQGHSSNVIVVFNKYNISSVIEYRKENTVILKVDNSLKIRFIDVQKEFFQHLIHLLGS